MTKPGALETENIDKIVAQLRARGRRVVEAIGHVMAPEEVPLEEMAADLIEALRHPEPDEEREGFATWHLTQAAEWRRTAAAYLKDTEPNKVGHDRCITKAEFHEAAAALLRTPTPVTAGWKLVPEEPTQAMLDKGEYVNSEWLNDNAPIGQRMYREPAKAVYAAMLSAAPAPAASGGEMEAVPATELRRFHRAAQELCEHGLADVQPYIERLREAGLNFDNACAALTPGSGGEKE